MLRQHARQSGRSGAARAEARTSAQCRHERRAHGELRLRRRDHRLGVRRQRRRAACRGEGLPGRRHGVRPALEGRGHPEDPVGPPALPVDARGGAVRDPEDRVPRRRADPVRRGRGRRIARLCQHAVRPAEAVLRCAGVGGHHRLGRRAGAASGPGDPDARRRPLPLHADRRRPRPAAGRERDRARGDVQQGPGRRLLREPRRRGGRSVLRRGRAAPDGMHLLRQLQHRLRSQRQEQADDELPLPRGEARRRDPRAPRGARARPARRRRVRDPCASPGLGAARGGSRTVTRTRPSRSSSPPTRTGRPSSCTTCSTRAA